MADDMDEAIANFTAITSAPAERAQRYLQLSEGNLEAAIQLFFESPDLDIPTAATSQAPPPPPASTRPRVGHPRGFVEDDDGVVHVPSDDDDDDIDMMDTPPPPPAASRPVANVDDDAELARRLQEEFYGQGSGVSGGFDPEAVRAPMARTSETLVGPDADWGTDPGEMRAAIADQLRMRERVRRGMHVCYD